ncbi:SPFH domain-containing protein [Tautonia marina]|uniref:SPFH domain-containing protein n=1 Tax=Tautonia marina TaxID=2653855 RepID=UPI001260795F
MKEFEVDPVSGFAWLTGFLTLLIASVLGLIAGIGSEIAVVVVSALVGIVVAIIGLTGLFTVSPNEAKVLQLFGEYKGTVRRPGLRWVNPFYSKIAISTRVRNFESGKLKVNDRNGNPIEIAAVVVWKVVDSAEALFHVDRYEHFVEVQSEAALRNLASGYAYDAHIEDELSLRGNTAEVADHLRTEIQDRLFKAGVEVIEARISHLAYAPEIAGAMLQRQQADAIIAARAKIVEGAVGMVEMALGMLASQNLVELDNEKKAAMVSNLLVVLCSDRGTQPIVNAAHHPH